MYKHQVLVLNFFILRNATCRSLTDCLTVLNDNIISICIDTNFLVSTDKVIYSFVDQLKKGWGSWNSKNLSKPLLQSSVM